MSRHRLDHGTHKGLYCEYGHDHMLGFFVEVFRNERSEPIAVLDFFKVGRVVTLHDALAFMVERRFFSHAELEDALVAVATSARVRSKRVLRVLRVVETFRTPG